MKRTLIFIMLCVSLLAAVALLTLKKGRSAENMYSGAEFVCSEGVDTYAGAE